MLLVRRYGVFSLCIACAARSSLGVPEPAAPIAVALALGDYRYPGLGGESFSCVLLSDGSAHCWGWTLFGQTGDWEPNGATSPAAAAIPVPLRSLSASQASACAVTTAGFVWCWGEDTAGQLGFDPANPICDCTSPKRIPGLLNIRQVSQGGLGVPIALTNDGTVETFIQCDHNSQGQIHCEAITPVPIAGLPKSIKEISSAPGHFCALATSGLAFCSGGDPNAYYGELGDGTDHASQTPVTVLTPAPFLQIAAGVEHTCAIDTGATVWCWGHGGMVGDGTAENRVLATRVQLPTGASRIASGDGPQTCAVLTDGTVWCWGPVNGRDRPVPERIVGLSLAIDVGVAADHACAILRDATVWCWGYIEGTNTYSPTPRQVHW